MINQVQLSTVPSGSLVQTSTAFTSSLNSALWTIDSGAFDHMTNQSHFFTTYSPSFGHLKIQNANDSLYSIIGKDSIIISENVIL